MRALRLMTSEPEAGRLQEQQEAKGPQPFSERQLGMQVKRVDILCMLESTVVILSFQEAVKSRGCTQLEIHFCQQHM